jgi:hypothetical protein
MCGGTAHVRLGCSTASLSSLQPEALRWRRGAAISDFFREKSGISLSFFWSQDSDGVG